MTDIKIQQDGDTFSARLQSVGRVTLAVSPGAVVGEGTTIGFVQTLKQRSALRLPDGTPALRIAEVHVDGHLVSSEFGETLLTARAVADDVNDRAGGASAGGSDADYVFKAPMSGQFYRRPSPEEPMFAEVGDTVSNGDQIGLVEVMKFFYPMEFSGPGAAKYELTRFVVEDGVSFNAGDPVAEFRRLDG